MSKSLENFIIGLGTASIFFAIYGIFRGDEFIDALSGIIIGASLIGAIFIEHNKKKNKK
ncbi:hypothetical protein [Tenacibaculum agarivorans]|uniref:hypothetical protein n=1 Tax=Tenacibaculum agarivorans TaxID=1908389 RepID=UPI000A7F4DB9|nr:hypothetical protein [Tenacibaculum agarivorans]